MVNTHILLLVAFLQLSQSLPAQQEHPSVDPFIMSRVDAEIGEFAHQSMLQKLTYNVFGFFCGATLINKWQALTAAHCVGEGGVKEFRIILRLRNQKNISQDSHPPQVQRRDCQVQQRHCSFHLHIPCTTQ